MLVMCLTYERSGVELGCELYFYCSTHRYNQHSQLQVVKKKFCPTKKNIKKKKIVKLILAIFSKKKKTKNKKQKVLFLNLEKSRLTTLLRRRFLIVASFNGKFKKIKKNILKNY